MIDYFLVLVPLGFDLCKISVCFSLFLFLLNVYFRIFFLYYLYIMTF